MSNMSKTPKFLSVIHSFIHSGHFYSAPSSPLLLRGAPDYSTDTVSEFHAGAHRQLQVKDLPKVPTWRLAGVEPTTLRLKAIDSTKAPPCPTLPLQWAKILHQDVCILFSDSNGNTRIRITPKTLAFLGVIAVSSELRPTF